MKHFLETPALFLLLGTSANTMKRPWTRLLGSDGERILPHRPDLHS